MAGPRYRAAAPETLRIEPLDVLWAVYHRASGMTHLLTEPAPEMLAALAEPLTREELLARLNERYELSEVDGLDARLDELIAAGLVEEIALVTSR